MAFLLSKFLASFALLLIAMSVHEFAHGWTADKFGDPTAKYSGRLTLNPLAHIDIIWTILIPLMLFVSTSGRFIFGSAKPVPINYWALRNPRRDIIWVGASGPLANFIFAILLRFSLIAVPAESLIAQVIVSLILINILLGVFNLIPIPPLDGSRIVMGLLPERLAQAYAMLEPFGFIILFIGIWTGAFNHLVSTVIAAILALMGIPV